MLAMAIITLDFPERLLAILRRRADSEGKSLEELISDAKVCSFEIKRFK